MKRYPSPPFPIRPQCFPGKTSEMDPRPDHGEESYRGSGRLAGKRAVITGGDSGIGLAVAIAFAREGADLVVAHLPGEDDAADARRWVEAAGRKAVLAPGDLGDPARREGLISRAVDEFGGIDILVNNAAYQRPFGAIEEISLDEWEKTFAVNVTAPFHLSQLAAAHMGEGGSIINTASVNAKRPLAELTPYAASKAALANMTMGLAQLLGPRGVRVNAVLPGPVWTPLVAAAMPPEAMKAFGAQTPLGRPAQPAELAPVYVMLASDEASYVTGALLTVAGGLPIM